MSKLSLLPSQNIKLVKDLSQKSFLDTSLLADLTWVQAILESNLTGKPSGLALNYCNLFGMKPGQTIPRGTRGIINLLTTEYENGKPVNIQQPFLYNNEIEDSVEQHKKLFTVLSRYQPLWHCTSFEMIAQAVYHCGYATDPSYPKNLIALYNQYK